MTEPTPRPLLFAFVFVGIGVAVLGLFGFPDNHDCDPVFPDKCLPGILLAGRAFWIAVGTAFAATAALRLLGGRRPLATRVALVAGAIEFAVGAWFAFALLTGLFLPAVPFFSLFWPTGAMVATIGLGVAFFAVAASDRAMTKFLT